MDFNNQPSLIMLMDINSCFATIEQQANPLLRNKPIAVAAYKTSKGSILAASVDAKKFGIKTGMFVKDAKKLYPNLVVLTPDPNKYRYVHRKLRSLLFEYTNNVEPKSIDEFAMDLKNYPILKKKTMIELATEIKKRIKEEVGDYITVSIGIAPNRYLAKIAAGIKKPDGLIEINQKNYLEIFSTLKLTDLTGIKRGNAMRLRSVGIENVLDFYNAPLWKLKITFKTVMAYNWYLRLKGYEIDAVPLKRKSFGNSVALGKNIWEVSELSPILARLTDKMTNRLRNGGYKAKGVHLSLSFKDGSYWHKGHALSKEMFDAREIFREALILLKKSKPTVPVRVIAVSCFDLTTDKTLQHELFSNVVKNQELIKAEDLVNNKWGEATIGIARSFKGENIVLDRIAFGGMREMEESLNINKN